MSAMAMEFLVWCDLETTGLDPTFDWVLEHCFVVTTAVAPFEEVRRCKGLVSPPGNWRSVASEVVTVMHEASGLALLMDEGEGSPLQWWDQELSGWLAELEGEKMLAGSGVARFDRAFLVAQLPRTMAQLRYDELDTGQLRRAFRLAGVALPEYVKPHRSEPDVDCAIGEWRQMHAMLERLA